MTDRVREFLHGSFLSVCAAGVVGVTGYLSRRIMTAYLSPGDFAFFYSMYALLMVLLTLFKYGSAETMLFLAPGWLQKGWKKRVQGIFSFGFKYNLVVFCAVSLLLAAGIPLWSRHYFPMAAATGDILLFIPLLLITALETFCFFSLNALKAFFDLSLLKIVKSALLIAGLWLGLRFAALPGAILSYDLAGLAAVLLALAVLHRRHRLSFRWQRTPRGVKREFLTSGGSFFALTLGYVVISDFGTVVLSLTGDAQEVALFNIAIPISMIVRAAEVVPQACIPSAAEAYGRGEYLFIRRAVWIFCAGVAAAVLVTVPLFWYWGEEIITLLFSAQYRMAWFAAMALAAAAWWGVAGQFCSGILNATGHRHAAVAAVGPVVAGAVVLLPLAGWLYGSAGVAVTVFALSLVWALGTLYRLLRILSQAERGRAAAGNR